MNPDEADGIRRRLDNLERLIHNLADRIERIERGNASYAPRERPPEPPPFIFGPLPSESVKPGLVVPSVPDPDAKRWTVRETEPEKAEPPTPAVDDIEYKIGLTGLLRGGASIVILGLLYLVALGIREGWITPQMQFAGELLLCSAFIGIGIWKRTEREEFGQIMTGIGSCGLYFSFAGAHAYKNLIGNEVLVGLFLAVSLANLGYSQWQSSRAFLTIGLIGGLIASVLPMQEHRAALTSVLHFLVVIPAAVIIVRNRWTAFVPMLWILSGLALIPLFMSTEPWLLRIGALYGSALLCCYIYAKTYHDPDWDPAAILIPLIATVAAVGGLMLDHIAVRNTIGSTNPAHGSWQVLILSALLGGLAYHFRSLKVPFASLAMSALAIASILAPIGLERTAEAFTFVAIAVVLAVASVQLKLHATQVLAWVAYSLGIVAYIAVWSTDDFRPEFESGFLVFAMLGSSVLAWSGLKIEHSGRETATMIASLVGLPFFLRLADIHVTPAWGNVSSHALFVGLAFFSIYALALAARFRWPAFFIAGSLGAMATLCAFGSGYPYPPALETALLGLLMATSIAVGVTSSLIQRPWLTTQIALPGIFIIGMAIRLSILWFSDQGEMAETSATAIAFLVCAFAAAFLTWRYKWQEAMGLGWACAALGAAFAIFGRSMLHHLDTHYTYVPRTGEFALEMGLLVVSHIATLAIAAVSKPFDQRLRGADFAAAVLIAPVWTRLVHMLLTEVGLKDAPAVSTAWILYASILLVIGFRRKNQLLRYLSFASFGLTIGKVLLVDLSALDPGIRVVILLGLGVAMLAGDYFYVRSRGAESS